MKIWYYLFNYTNKEKITGTESNLHFFKRKSTILILSKCGDKQTYGGIPTND